jgi:type I restriction enzyme R subunit
MERLDEDLPEGRYAIIVDEAHSSQSGETVVAMKSVLGGKGIAKKAKEQAQAEGGDEAYELALRWALSRGRQESMSFFAFTATPKHKTLEIFGTPGPDGKPLPFDLYPMRQAIEEGFILDVLQNYTTYKTYYKLVQRSAEDREVDKQAAVKALARFAALHPHNIAQKVEIIVEHFRAFTRHKIGGKAKAMVVTDSREAAVRYKKAFDAYVKAKKYADVHSLVAFSGHVILDEEPDAPYTEVGMNQGIKEKELPEKFAGDEYQVLLVADKYQTGFDEPLLHSMYVDKRLDGVQAVQTTSRLNRAHPGKDDTFILDFRNDVEDIVAAFQPYYEATSIVDKADPQQLYHLRLKLQDAGVFSEDDVTAFAGVFFATPQGPSAGTAAYKKLHAIVDPCAQRFRDLSEEERTQFRGDLTSFLSLYAFVAQVVPYQDAGLEALYGFGRLLAAKIRDERSPRVDVGDDVALQYYALKKTAEGALVLEKGGEYTVSGPTAVGTGEMRRDVSKLSELITTLNDRFGTDFTEADQVFFDSLVAEAVERPELQQAAVANTIDNFAYVYNRAEEGLIIDRHEKAEDIVTRLLNDDDFRRAVSPLLMKQVYETIRARAEAGDLPSGRPAPGVASA